MSKNKIIDERVLDETYKQVMDSIVKHMCQPHMDQKVVNGLSELVDALQNVNLYMSIKREVLAELKKESNS